MKVATTQRHLEDEHGCYRDVLECSYISYFSGYDVELFPVSNALEEPGHWLEHAGDGVLLTGGDEVDPGRYGGEMREEYVVSPRRDRTEVALVEAALERGIPVFGVCRGLQTLNVYFDGAVEDIDRDESVHPPGESHEVEFTHEDVASEIDESSTEVNSYHDQAVTVESLAPELEAFAVTEEGYVEGLYHPDHAVAAVQWHPERDDERPIDRLLVESFRQSSLYWG